MHEVEFKTLLGYHVLSGCDTDGVIKGEQPFYGDANVIDFVLDGRVFSAVEDPDDGYRSSLDKMFVDRVASVKNMFPPCHVIGTRRQDREYEKNDVIDFIDVLTGKIFLAWVLKTLMTTTHTLWERLIRRRCVTTKSGRELCNC